MPMYCVCCYLCKNDSYKIMKNEKFIIYQMLPRIFGNAKANGGTGKFKDITPEVLEELKELNITHIWYTGIIKHSTAGERGVKGTAGSPYAINDYYDVNHYFASRKSSRMKEFEALVERTAQAGMGTIIDFVPNHVACDYVGTQAPFTDENYYPGKTFDGDWSDTAKLNYSSHDTWVKMRDILLFWASKGIAGFRCDMIELVTVDFWKWAIPQIKEQFPGIIFIGEAYQPENYWNYFNIGGFDYLYDKSGFYDTLRRIVRGEDSASSITRQWQQLGDFQPKMLNFLENHDEDRIPSEYFASSPFKALSALFVSLFYNTAPFMIYAGQEFGVGPEKTSIFDFCSLEPLRRWNKGIKESDSQKYLHYEESDLYAIYKAFCDIAVNDPVICKGDTFDLQYANFENGNYNHHRQFSFLRHYEGTVYLCVANFEDHRVDVEINIPQHAFDYYGIQPDETLNPNEKIKVSIEKNAGTILRIK